MSALEDDIFLESAEDPSSRKQGLLSLSPVGYLQRVKDSKSLFQNPSQHLWKCAKQTLEDFFFECFGINVLWDREERQSEMSLKIGLSSSFLVELILIFNTPSAIRRKERPLALSTDLFWAHLFFSCRHYIFSYVIHWLIFIIFLALWESESPLSFILN